MAYDPPPLGAIVHDEVVPARAPWLRQVGAGQTLRIVDLEGIDEIGDGDDCL